MGWVFLLAAVGEKLRWSDDKEKVSGERKNAEKSFSVPNARLVKKLRRWWEPGKTARQGQAEGRSFTSVKFGISMKPS